MSPSPRQAAVDFVNDVRHAIKLDPIPDLVPGVPGDQCRCAIAESCTLGTTRLYTVVSGGYTSVRAYDQWTDGGFPLEVHRRDLPEAVAEFVERFDQHGYPDLDRHQADPVSSWERWVH